RKGLRRQARTPCPGPRSSYGLLGVVGFFSACSSFFSMSFTWSGSRVVRISPRARRASAGRRAPRSKSMQMMHMGALYIADRREVLCASPSVSRRWLGDLRVPRLTERVADPNLAVGFLRPRAALSILALEERGCGRLGRTW